LNLSGTQKLFLFSRMLFLVNYKAMQRTLPFRTQGRTLVAMEAIIILYRHGYCFILIYLNAFVSKFPNTFLQTK